LLKKDQRLARRDQGGIASDGFTLIGPQGLQRRMKAVANLICQRASAWVARIFHKALRKGGSDRTRDSSKLYHVNVAAVRSTPLCRAGDVPLRFGRGPGVIRGPPFLPERIQFATLESGFFCVCFRSCVSWHRAPIGRLSAPFARHLSGGIIPGDLRLREDQLQPDQPRHRSSDQVLKVDADTGEEVPSDEIMKGYKVDSDTYIEVTKDELQNIALDSTRTIEIDEFVAKADIDPRYLIRPYYLAPDGK
jgi:hypothetical protein